MNSLLTHLAIIVGIVFVAVLIYEAYDWLPQSWRDKMIDTKTKVITAVGFFIPDLLTLIGQIPQLGLEDIVPDQYMNVTVKIITGLTFISRLQSFWDTRTEPDQEA